MTIFLISLSEVCSIIDQITWCEYRPRTTSSALSAIGSQIGRNIKAVAQVLWFCLYMFLELSVEDMDDMQAILRTVFYLSKLSYLLFNEQGVVWTPRMLEIFNELVRTVEAYLSREMDSVMKGAKSHDLTGLRQNPLRQNPLGQNPRWTKSPRTKSPRTKSP